MVKKKKVKLKPGDIFSIKLENGTFCFGRALKQVDLGFVIEVFDFFSSKSSDFEEALVKERLFLPQILDAHSIFWLRNEGDWSIEKHGEDDFLIKDENKIRFVYGLRGDQKLIDIFGNEENISDEDAKEYFRYNPKGDIDIKQLIKFWVDLKKENS